MSTTRQTSASRCQTRCPMSRAPWLSPSAMQVSLHPSLTITHVCKAVFCTVRRYLSANTARAPAQVLRPLLAHQKHDGALSSVITQRAWQLLCKCAIRQTVLVVWWVYPSAACLSLCWCSTCMQKRRSGSRQEGGHPWSRPHRYALLPGSYIVQI